ncbi:hypothetical protein ABZY31_02615 [Streptomyces sp. NPDC006529]|uniref:hypothetical protein n=1 Tax=Streptomyces sp. NPDC006529 TaxID=3157177 RepID=UPI0033BF64F4
MADDRTRWLDKAAADRLLRGEPVDRLGDARAQADAARLRDALDSLAPGPLAGAAELPGEAAALAAFRAARPDRAAAQAAPAHAGPASAGEPLVAIVRVPAASGPARGPAPRRVGAWRLGLAAAVAGVAIGGVAAAAGTGLFDRALHLNAGPLPSAESTFEVVPDPVGGTSGPSTGATRRPQPPGTVDGFGASGGARTPSTPEGRTTPGATGAAADGGAGGGAGGTGATTGTGPDKDGREHFGLTGGGEAHDTLRGAADLCRDYRSGKLSKDRENRLNLLAKGRQQVKRYCEDLLDAAPGPKGTVPPDTKPVPVPLPGSSNPSGATGSLGLRLRR